MEFESSLPSWRLLIPVTEDRLPAETISPGPSLRANYSRGIDITHLVLATIAITQNRETK